MAGAGCDCSASFAGAVTGAGCDCSVFFGGAGSGNGAGAEGAAEDSAFGGEPALAGCVSAGEFFGGTVSGGETLGAPSDVAACFGAVPSSDCFGLAPSRPISTTMLRSSRKVRTSGVPLRVKTTATESKSTSASIDFRVGGSDALTSARSQFTCWSKLSVSLPSARSGITLTVPGIVNT